MNNTKNEDSIIEVDLKIVLIFTIILAGLKYFKILTLSWLWVVSPVWLTLIILIVLVIWTLIKNYFN